MNLPLNRISLVPFASSTGGEVIFFRDKRDFIDAYNFLSIRPMHPEIERDLEGALGTTILAFKEHDEMPTYLIHWGGNPVTLAHEILHVLLEQSKYIGHNPTQGDGEPFCYMHSHLMEEALK